MSYATQVYRALLQGNGIDRSHVSAWQNFDIARTFLDLGFQVDVIHFEDYQTVPERCYDVVVDIVSNLGRLADHLDGDAVKILFPMFAHWTVHNSRSYARHAALARRRGVSIMLLRILTPNDSVERADHILCTGGIFNQDTYSYSDTPVTAISANTPTAIDEYLDRDIQRRRHHCVWIGGSSAIHKGLDLVLEAFASLPEFHLTVIGKVPDERRFTAVYRNELFELPNIETVGWMDTLSPAFRKIASESIAIVVPSASEASCGSVIAGMMNGLIPITTESTDIDTSGIGFSIEEDTVEAVRNAVLHLADQTNKSLADLSRSAWEAVQLRYGRQKFLKSLRAALCDILYLEPARVWQNENESPRIPKIELV
ncbi:MAG: glycosyltransferase [Woeseia sp.]